MAAGIETFNKTQTDTGGVKDMFFFLNQVEYVISKHFGLFIYSVYRPTIIYLVWDAFGWVALQ